MIDHYADDAHVGEMTRLIKARTASACLQAHWLAPYEDAHIALLLKFFDPPYNSRVLDLGAGTGAVADGMANLRSDLKFVLLNHSQAQLDMASDKHYKLCADFQDIPRLPVNVDAAMMLYALGHSRPRPVMAEVSRVLPIGGVFFLYDLTAPVPPPKLREHFNYVAHSTLSIIRSAHGHGMLLTKTQRPHRVYTSHMDALLTRAAFEDAFDGAQPTLLRFVKTQ